MLTHELANPRRAGQFALTTYEAAATFSLVSITPLPAEGEPADAEGVDETELKRSVERAELAAAAATTTAAQKTSELASLHARVEAERAKYEPGADASAARLSELSRSAHAAEVNALLAAAEARLASAKQQVATTKESAKPDDKALQDAAAAQELAQAEQQLNEAKEKQSKQSEEYTSFGTIYPKTSSGRRFALARWITDRSNPLTARVAVNHIWTRHFGEPLTASMFDFGLRTPAPLQQDVLDWLAVDFMESGWSMKKLHRLMVTSAAYRRSSASSPDDPNLALDTDNHYLWRMHSRRMEAEIIRDSLLQMAGNLDCTLGGRDLPVAEAATGNRRTIYYRYAREPVDKVAVMLVFDPPNIEECYRRQETVSPQHALMLMNSKMSLTGAGEIAAAIERHLTAKLNDDDAFVNLAFECVLGRAPSNQELLACQAGLQQIAALPPADAQAEDVETRRARQAIVHVLLNHNDFISIR